jgi:outer membrane protein TolC
MRWRSFALVLVPLGTLAGPLPAAAEDPTRSPLAQLGTPGYPAPTLHGELKLSLADAIAMGLENNLGVEILRHQPLITHQDYLIAWGSYDPEWFTELGYSEIEDPTANQLLGSGDPTVPDVSVTTTRATDGLGGVQGLIPWLNSSYRVELAGQGRTTDITVIALSPEFTSSFSLEFTQPLLRGLIWNEPWTAVKTSQVVEEAAWEAFRRDVMNTVQAIEDGYWALIADDERVRVAEKSLETAQALLDQVQTQYEVGVVSKVEIAEAEAGVAARDFDLIVAGNRYENTMDELINLVLGPNLTADSRISIEPTDRPDQYIAFDIEAEKAARIAFQRRPELAIAQKEIERLEINLKFAKNQRLPRFDAVLSWGNRGLAGKGETRDLGNWPDTFTNPPGTFFTEDAAHQFTARGILSIPLGNVSGRHGVSKAQLDLRRSTVQLRRQEQDIILEIRRAVRDLLAAQRGIEAAERQRVAAAEQLRAERIRLEYGESTPFDVLLREQDLVRAEQGYIGAFQTYRSSVTGLDRAQGTILRNRNVQIEEVARLR